MTKAAVQSLHVQNPDARQAEASDPAGSRWVGASAGTGKTKVLIDRVLRLLLPRPGQGITSATRPEKILCLTFTKTAAAEMSNRIYKRLGEWAVMDSKKLERDIASLMGTAPDVETVDEARRLFARALDTPGGLKIMTIHAFCQSVLKRFPIEAGLPPHFELMDESSALDYLRRCLHDMINETRHDSSLPLARAFDTLALYLDAGQMSQLMSDMVSKRRLFSDILKHRGDDESSAVHTAAAMRQMLGVAEDASERDFVDEAAALSSIQESDLRRALQALLSSGGARDGGKAQPLQTWLEDKAGRPAMFSDYKRIFLNADGGLFSDSFLASKSAIKTCPDILDVMKREATRLMGIEHRRTAFLLAQVNAAALAVGADMMGRYTRHKRLMDALDYDDLILKTADLLSGDRMPWVLYKLDEGIDHILVDEAQDTNPYQWRVIEAISEDFLSGYGRRDDIPRTLFVVGDEKQSIFSFQGADPYEFDRRRIFFGERVRPLQEGWEVFLEHSFRSGRAVLEAVDRVFAQPDVRQGVALDTTRDVRHALQRRGQGGCVEVWPLIKIEKEKETDAWSLPTSIAADEHAHSILARKIAVTIRGWLDEKDILLSKNRPVRPGDILILLQSRDALRDHLIRALKEKNIPVAGVDRMKLGQDVAVMDLVAFAQCVLQINDDLMLATVLKTPFVGLSEDELFAVCRNRQGSLWSSLAGKRPDVAAYLSRAVAQAKTSTPFEFFTYVLDNPCVADAVSGRRALRARLGSDIAEAEGEFLNIALHDEQTHTPSLQKFVDRFLRDTTEIKREQDAGLDDQVRIMTVHAAKGLQAPIVFMPDAGKKMHDRPGGRIQLVWPKDETGLPLWTPNKSFENSAFADMRATLALRQEEEYRRLMYVAMTRAEDRLYVAGIENRATKPGCWHHLIAQALPEGRISYPQTEKPEDSRVLAAPRRAQTAPLSSWARMPPADEPFPPLPVAPSRPGEDEPAVFGPFQNNNEQRFHRGIVVHKILELLPQLPEKSWDGALLKYLARPSLGLDEKDQGVFAKEILDVLRHPEFAPIFGPGSQAEVPLTGLVTGKQKNGDVVSGQIDRLLVRENDILIVDYKTNRPPPRRVEDIPDIYLKQMTLYHEVIRAIYPEHKIKCALLWTDVPLLMPVNVG